MGIKATSTRWCEAIRRTVREADGAGDPEELPLARAMSATFWLVGALITVTILPFAPPTEAIGDAGWALVGLGILVAVVIGARRFDRRREATLTELYISGYLSLAMVAALEWLAGGRETPYAYLYLLPILYAVATHPRDRVLAFLAVFAALLWAPLLYGSLDGDEVREIAVQLAVYLFVGVMVWGLFVILRAQRSRIRRSRRRARRDARRDDLTRLGNRRAMSEALERETARARREGTPLSVLVGDLDHFKRINDRAGHQGGDLFLQQVAERITSEVRASDLAFRWAGDEFAILLPGVDRETSDRLAERIAEQVAGIPTPLGVGEITFTWGIGSFDPDANEVADAFVVRADQRLMEAKRARDEGRVRP